jgi:hypothetical protein
MLDYAVIWTVDQGSWLLFRDALTTFQILRTRTEATFSFRPMNVQSIFKQNEGRCTPIAMAAWKLSTANLSSLLLYELKMYSNIWKIQLYSQFAFQRSLYVRSLSLDHVEYFHLACKYLKSSQHNISEFPSHTHLLLSVASYWLITLVCAWDCTCFTPQPKSHFTASAQGIRSLRTKVGN